MLNLKYLKSLGLEQMGEIGFLDCFLNGTRRILWNTRICSIRHEESH